MSTFAQTLDQILNTYWRLHPIEATHTGIHMHDAAMPDWSAAGQQARRDWQSQASAQLTRFADADLSHDERLNKQVLLAQLALFQIYDEWGYAKRAPALYIEQALNGLHFLLARPDQTAPQAVRDANLLARLSAIPPLLQQAQANLDPALIPPEFIEIALPNVKGAIGFIASLELPPQPSAEPARQAALQALHDYGSFIQQVQPAGQFALGRALYERILREHHGLQLSAQDVHNIGRELTEQINTQMNALAQQISPSTSWQHIVEAQKAAHPTRDTLLQTYHNEMLRARDFVLAKDLVSIPAGEQCEIRPTAPFLRATMPLGHFDKTPPFDPADNTGILYITPIDASLPAARQDELLSAHCFTAVRSICFHETYPGHHLQFWHSKRYASAVRNQFPSTVYLEGWALYCEEMMAENGFFDTPELQLWQLKNAIWRSVRMMVDTGLHTGQLTLDQAAQLLVAFAGLEPNTARGEVRRYTTSPTQPSSYMLGKLRVMALRAQYRQRMGAGYSQRAFHDAFLQFSSVTPGLIPDGLA